MLGGPVAGGVSGDTGGVQTSGGVFEERQCVEPVAQGGVDVEEIDRDDGVGLGGQELSPGRAGAVGCRVDAGGMEDLPDGRGTDTVAESGEFAVDSPVALSGVLAGQAQDELFDRGAGARSS